MPVGEQLHSQVKNDNSYRETGEKAVYYNRKNVFRNWNQIGKTVVAIDGECEGPETSSKIVRHEITIQYDIQQKAQCKPQREMSKETEIIG